jgi:hypothetical protein
MFRTLTTKLTTTVLPAAAVLAAVGAASVLGAGTAAAATPDAMLTSSQGSTGMTVHVVNNSNETMTVTSSSNPYGHWQDQATDIAPHTAKDVSDYSNNIEGSEIDLTYQMPDGTQINVQGLVPLAGSNSVTASSSTTHFTAVGHYASGYHPTFEVDVADA